RICCHDLGHSGCHQGCTGSSEPLIRKLRGSRPMARVGASARLDFTRFLFYWQGPWRRAHWGQSVLLYFGYFGIPLFIQTRPYYSVGAGSSVFETTPAAALSCTRNLCFGDNAYCFSFAASSGITS